MLPPVCYLLSTNPSTDLGNRCLTSLTNYKRFVLQQSKIVFFLKLVYISIFCRTSVSYVFNCILQCFLCLLTGLNLVGRREYQNHSYQPASFTAMECDPSPSRHSHRSRYQSSLMGFGPSSLQYPPYPGHTVPDTAPPKHNMPVNGPASSQADRDDSPMVGVCMQQSPVAIH